MKKIATLVFLGLFFVSCGPKRMGCGPYRRCEIKLPTKTDSESNKTQLS